MNGLDPREALWRRVRDTPMALAFGLEHRLDGDDLHFEQSPVPHVLDTDGAIHAGAVAALVDQACSAAAYRSMASYVSAATLDLRVDWLAKPRPDTGLVVLPTVIGASDATILLGARVFDQDREDFIASGMVTMALGRLPGGGTADLDTPLPAATPVDCSSLGGFGAFVGLEETVSGLALSPTTRHVGSVLVPAVHGGMIAAALLGMARRLSDNADVPITQSTSFLRATRADAPFHLTGEILKSGKSVSIVQAWIEQGGRLTASATVKLRSRG